MEHYSRDPWAYYSSFIYEYYGDMLEKHDKKSKIIGRKESNVGRELFTTTYNISRNIGYPW